MGSRGAIALELGRRRVVALLASDDRHGLRVRQVVEEPVPADLNAHDPVAMGKWLRSVLKKARIPFVPVTVAIGREQAFFKRLTLPTTDESELPEMTRLAIRRDLPVESDEFTLDYVLQRRDPTACTVIVIAVPYAVVEFARQAGRSARLPVHRISLRTTGAAAMLQTLTPGECEAILLMDVTPEGVEFCVVNGDGIQYSRVASVPDPHDRLAVAEALITETRRSWMSFRMTNAEAKVDRAIILGDRRVGEYARESVHGLLGIPVELLDRHPLVESSGVPMESCWPLAGLLLESREKSEVLNLAKPRRAPDLAGRTRRRVLAAAAIVALVILSGWVIARRDLTSLRTRVERLTDQQRLRVAGFARYWRDVYKLEHVTQWESTGVDWLSHARHVTALAPTNRLVFDSWTGTFGFLGVDYDEAADRWTADQSITIVLDGEAEDRETADAFREALIRAAVYTTGSTGADTAGGQRLPFRFTYRLRTDVGRPEDSSNHDGDSPAEDPNHPTGPGSVSR